MASVKSYLASARTYGLSWRQVCNLAFSLDVTYQQLLDGVDKLSVVPDEWQEVISDDRFDDLECFPGYYSQDSP